MKILQPYVSLAFLNYCKHFKLFIHHLWLEAIVDYNYILSCFQVRSSNNTEKRKKNNSFSLSPEKDNPETRQKSNTLPSDLENSLESSQESYVLPVHKKKKETPIYSKLLKEGLRSKHLINENELITQFKWLQDNHNDYVSAENFRSTRDVELLIKSLLKCQTAVLVCIEITYSTELHVSHQFLNNFRTEYMIFPVKNDFCILMRTFWNWLNDINLIQGNISFK